MLILDQKLRQIALDQLTRENQIYSPLILTLEQHLSFYSHS